MGNVGTHAIVREMEVSECGVAINCIEYSATVKPPKRGHFGTVAFVLSSEVVLLSEVAPFLLLNPIQCVRNVF